jgi:hypothetical protein
LSGLSDALEWFLPFQMSHLWEPRERADRSAPLTNLPMLNPFKDQTITRLGEKTIYNVGGGRTIELGSGQLLLYMPQKSRRRTGQDGSGSLQQSLGK